MNKEAQLLLANSAYHLGLSDEAMAAYDRVLMISPNNVTAKIQLTKLYMKAKAYRLASLELNPVLEANLSGSQKKEALRLKKQLNDYVAQNTKKDGKPFVNVELSLGLLYDSNVNGDIGEETHKIPAYNLSYKGSKEKGKLAHFESISISKDISLSRSAGLFAYVDLYNKNYINHNSKTDLAYAALGLSPYYNLGKFRVSLPLSFNRVFLDYKGYLNNSSAGLDIKRAIDNGLIEGGFLYSQSRFDGINEAKDASNQSLYVGFRYRIFDNIIKFAQLKYAINKEKEDLRTDISYSSYGVNLGLNAMLSKSLIGTFKFSFTNYAYDDENKVFLNKRSDKVYGVGTGLGYSLSKSSYLSLDINYLSKQSNQFVYDYDKFTIPLVYNYRF